MLSHQKSILNRQSELQVLHQFLSQLHQNVGNQSLLITGTAGTGKSQLLAYSEQSDFPLHTLRITLTEKQNFMGEMIPAIAGLFDRKSLDALLTPLTTATLNGYLRNHRPIISLKKDELPLDLSHVTTKTKAESIAGLLGSYIAKYDLPLLLLIDDFQYADEEDLEFLSAINAYIGEEALPIAWMITYKTEGKKNIPAPLKELLSPENTIQLNNFDSEGTKVFIEALLGSDFILKNEDFGNKLHKVTGGNPLYLQEGMAYLKQLNVLTHVNDYWELDSKAEYHLPASLTENILARVKVLLQDSQSALLAGILAVSAASLNIQELISIPGLSEKQVKSKIKELIKCHFLYNDLTFSHPLISYQLQNSLENTHYHLIINKLYQYFSTQEDLPPFAIAPYAMKVNPSTNKEKREILQTLRNAVSELFGKTSRIKELARWSHRCYELETHQEKRLFDLAKYAYLLQTSGDIEESSSFFEYLLKSPIPTVFLHAAPDYIPTLILNNEIAKVKRLLNKGIRLAEEMKDNHALLRLLSLKYVNRRRLGLKKSGDRLHKQISSIPRNNTEGKILWCRHSLDRANDYFLTNKLPEAEELINSALKLAKKTENQYMLYVAYERLQFQKLMTGDCFTALEFCKKSQSAALAYGHPHFIAMSQSYLAQALTFCGKFEEAVEYGKKSLNSLLRMKKYISAQTPLAHLAGAYQNLGEYKKAARLIQSQEKMIVEHKVKNLQSILYSIMGSSFCSDGKYKSGQQYIRKGIAIAKKDGLPNYEGQGYGFLGDAYITKKTPEYKKALTAYQKADSIFFHQRELGLHGCRNALKILHACTEVKNGHKKWFAIFEERRKNSDYNLEFEAASLFFKHAPPKSWEALFEKGLTKEDAMGTGFIQAYRAAHLLQSEKNSVREAEGYLLPLILTSIRKRNMDVFVKFMYRFQFSPISAEWLDSPLIQLEIILTLGPNLKKESSLPFSGDAGYRSRITAFANQVLSGDYSPLERNLSVESSESIFSTAVFRLTEYLSKQGPSPFVNYIQSQLTNNELSIKWLKRLIKQRNQVTIKSFGELSIICDTSPPSPENWIRQSRRLLAYLLTQKLHNHRLIPKWTIIDDLWADDTPAVLDKRLRQTLYRLRHLFPVNLQVQLIQSETDTHSYGIINTDDIWWDAGEFVNGYKRGRQCLHYGEEFNAMLEFERVQPFYTGKYLQGMEELWSQNVSQELERYYYFMMDCLCEYYNKNKSPEMVHFYADKIRRIDPLEECGIFWQVKAWFMQRKKAVAFRNFNEWSELYKSELEFAPEFTIEEISGYNSFREFWKGKEG